MTDIKHLAQLMHELDEQLSICMRCGMCQAVCPVFFETRKETDVARGKLALLDGLVQEMFKNPKGVFEHLNRCLLCGTCADNCPSSVNSMEIFLKARAILTGFMGLPPLKRAILRGVLANPRMFNRIMEWGTKFQNIFTKPANEMLGTSCARIVSPLLSDRHFKPLAPVPFHQKVRSLNTISNSSDIKVAFYVGCLIDKIFPHIADSVIDILKHHDIGIYLPEEQACCGIPAISSGDPETFNHLIRHNLDLFSREDFDFLVTACATCTATIKTIWPMMAQDDDDIIKESIRNLSEKTRDINEFLASYLGLEDHETETKDSAVPITYHDPCHLKKTLGISTEPRILIHSNPQYQLKEMPEADLCCGLGGSFNLQYYEISANIGKRKGDNIRRSGCAVIASGCPACMIQISDNLSKSGDRIQVMHPVEIYSESL